MFPLIIGVVLIATFFAMRGAVRGVSRAYQTRRDDWGRANPDAIGIARRAAAVGHMAAMVRYGPSALYHGWRAGWSSGWGIGQEWADRHRPVPADEPLPVVDNGALRFGDDPEDPNAVATCPTCRGRGVVNGLPCPACRARQEARNEHDKPFLPPRRLRAVPDQTSAPTSNNQPKEPDMAIETATGGEVTSPETLHAELTSVVREASADMDDASGDEQRAKEDLARIENITGSVARLMLPQRDIGMVVRLKDPAQRRLAAAQARKAAASERLAQAQGALDMAAKHVQIQAQGAAGEFYQN